MRSGKGSREEEEYEEEEFSSRKQDPSASAANNNNKDARNSDKASVIRSKHSVTEQRRRSKINESKSESGYCLITDDYSIDCSSSQNNEILLPTDNFIYHSINYPGSFLCVLYPLQKLPKILRDLIPHTDQKRDTASFLLEVIEYVQYLQEKVQKYEGPYQAWGPEPAKLMPWRNSHWLAQNSGGHPQASKNGSGPGSFLGKFDDNNAGIPLPIITNAQIPLETDPSRDITSRVIDHHPEFANKGMPLPMPPPVQGDGGLVQPLQRPISDAHSADGPVNSDGMNQPEGLTIEGGTISISSAYSQGLLSSLTQALKNAGVDLSNANIHVQIDLGKRANKKLMPGASASQEQHNSPNQAMTHLRDVSIGEDSDQAQKRLKK